jgi:hypothetical protein
MNGYSAPHYAAGGLIGWVLAAWLIPFLGMAGAVDERFDLLQIGTRTYTNVTVTTKAKDYIFLLHTGGMTSIKTAELPLAIKERLGYAVPKPATNTAAVWAKRELAKISLLPSKQLVPKPVGKPYWRLSAMNLLSSKAVFVVLGIALLIYLLHCYCCILICRKTGNPPGVLVWLPVLQLFPLLRAAGMSGWWFLAYCVPLLNIVAQILLCLNIVKARGHGAWVGALLLLPIINLFAFLYLALSGSAPAEEEAEPEPKIMTLEAA